MQPSSSGSLPRYRSAPATWLETLLLKEEITEQDPLSFTQLLSTSSSSSNAAGPSSAFLSPQPQHYAADYDYPSPLVHLSPTALPNPLTLSQEVEHSGKASDDMMKLDKILEDSVPCRVRAKRGCATHPRSIAERVRRTRISDRIRKLQELVPNMDKQTNTADMLDEAVAYVKLLQKQIEELSEQQRRCKCMVQE